MAPGRMEYTSVNEGDEIERFSVLVLDSPLCGKPGAEEDSAEAPANIVEVQVMFKEGLFPLAGRTVKITGSWMEGETGHHHTPVMIDAETVTPLSPAPQPPPAQGWVVTSMRGENIREGIMEEPDREEPGTLLSFENGESRLVGAVNVEVLGEIPSAGTPWLVAAAAPCLQCDSPPRLIVFNPAWMVYPYDYIETHLPGTVWNQEDNSKARNNRAYLGACRNNLPPGLLVVHQDLKPDGSVANTVITWFQPDPQGALRESTLSQNLEVIESEAKQHSAGGACRALPEKDSKTDVWRLDTWGI
ncbi:MAG: DUF4431 domain-containing protein [Deltaproteobacteria bacterium]|nr:DUF4431 domain-containing protein [Deltaproteobacteria bacterium]